MPKFSKAFGRRKSSTNVLEDLAKATPAVGESTFRVLERPQHKPNSSFDGGIKLAKAPERPNTSPMQRGEDNMFAGLNRDRDSGGSNSNTTSTFTTDNSSRLSAVSTAPSTHNSGEYHRQDERVSHPDRTYDIPTQKQPSRAPSAFSLKAGARTFSFGKGKGTPPPLKEEFIPLPPPSSIVESMGAGKSRGVNTASNQASAVAPPKLENQDLDLGGTFSTDMFADFKRKSLIQLDQNMPRNYVCQPQKSGENNRVELKTYTVQESAEPAKPLPAYSNRSDHHLPPPLTIDRSRNIEPSPYSWTSHDSGRELMAATPSPPPHVYMNSPLNAPPPVPAHGMLHETHSDNFASHARPQRSGGPVDSSLRRSGAFAGKRRSTFELGDPIDEDANLLRESYHASRQLNDSSYESNQRADLPEATPKQQMRRIHTVSSEDESEDMFDASIAENAILANQISEGASSPPPQKVVMRNKIMTPAQFERAKQDHERAVMLGGASSSKDEEDDDDIYDEDEDEAERLKKIAKQRKQQDAHMAVFRQGMMKSTGETAAPFPSRPPITSSLSTPNLVISGIDDDSDEDEEVPLAILQAHGFPNKNRPPSQLTNGNLRTSSFTASGSANGSAIGGAAANLPIFARNLPSDPYFGASVVNPLNRDPLAFGSGTGSSRGGGGYQTQGLIGVIATEERNRAMRRGSPSATNGGAYTPQGSGGFGAMGMGVGMPNMHPNAQMQMPQQPMMNPMAMGPMGGPMMMNPMMGMPTAPQMMQPAPGQTPQDQMDFMRMQMHMMQMQMMNGGIAPPPIAPAPAMNGQRTSTMTGTRTPNLQVPGIPGRPMTSGGRTMSLIDPNAAPWRNSNNIGGGYTPSIAPSERSNIGLPGRYRPVSTAQNENNGSASGKTPSVFGLPTGGDPSRWSNGNASATVKGAESVAPTVRAVSSMGLKKMGMVGKGGEEREEDEEEAWRALKVKREAKRGKWKEKKADEEIRGMLGRFG